MIHREKILKRLAVLISIIFAASGQISAQVIFSNFGSDPLFGPAFVVGPEDGFARATRFIATGSHDLGSIDIPLAVGRGPNEVTIEFREDSSGTPGDVMESITIIDEIAPGPTPVDPLLSVTSIENNTFVGGAAYWFVLRSNNNVDSLINPYKTGQTGSTVATQTSSGVWITNIDRGGSLAIAFQLKGTEGAGVIPEPSTYALVTGFGCLAFVIWSRRRNASDRDCRSNIAASDARIPREILAKYD